MPSVSYFFASLITSQTLICKIQEAQELSSRSISDLMETFSSKMKMDIMKKNPPVGEESLKAGMDVHLLESSFPRDTENIMSLVQD